MASFGRLKTYTEQIEDPDMPNHIKSAVKEADQIIFLGFAFHPQNMELMTMADEHSIKRIYSTGKGISRQETDEVKRRIVQLYSHQHDIAYHHDLHIEDNSTCAELFSMHWRNLSAT